MSISTHSVAAMQARSVNFTLVVSAFAAIVMIIGANLWIYKNSATTAEITIEQKVGFYRAEACVTVPGIPERCESKDFPKGLYSMENDCSTRTTGLLWGALGIVGSVMLSMLGAVFALRKRETPASAENIRALRTIVGWNAFLGWAAVVGMAVNIGTRFCGTDSSDTDNVILTLGLAPFVVGLAATLTLTLFVLLHMYHGRALAAVNAGNDPVQQPLNAGGVVQSVEQQNLYQAAV